jgi:hypothetical protein
MANPATLMEWWNHVQGADAALKVCYFLRNQSAIRSSVLVPLEEEPSRCRWTDWPEYLCFLADVAGCKLARHDTTQPEPFGCYSLTSERMRFVLDLAITRTGPSLCVLAADAKTADGTVVNLRSRCTL